MSVEGTIPAGVPLRDARVTRLSEATSLASAMRVVQSRLGRKAAEQLAVITGQDAKTSQRQFAQGRPPNGNAVYAMVRHPIVGPAFIVQATRNLPDVERREFWTRMIVAAGAALEKDIAL